MIRVLVLDVDYICPQRGGYGAVRGAVQKILEEDGRWKDAVEAAFGVTID